MKILKKIVIALVILIALVLITALFVKKEYAVEKTITINQPKQVVFDYIRLLKNQNNYSIWNKKDPNIKQEYKGTDGTVGFISAWEGNDDVGKGEQEITKIADGERMEMKLRFREPFEAQDDAYMTTTMIDSTSTKVAWGFKGAFPYPMNIMQLFISMDKAVGNDLAAGLENLKKELEK